MATKQLVETGIWNDQWFRKLSNKSKLLFLYLLTNRSINPAGMYEPDEVYLNYLEYKNLEKEINKLAPKILYDAEHNIVWIVKYFALNSKGEKMAVSAQNTLDKYSKSFLVSKFINFYKSLDFKDNGIGYVYPMDSVSILSNEHEHEHEHDNDNEHEHEHEDTLLSKKNNTKQKTTNIPYEEIVNMFIEITNRKIKHGVKQTEQLIKARWLEGMRQQDFRNAITHCHREWSHDLKMSSYVRVSTIFSGKMHEYVLQGEESKKIWDKIARLEEESRIETMEMREKYAKNKSNKPGSGEIKIRVL